jgi:hypothetical protein
MGWFDWSLLIVAPVAAWWLLHISMFIQRGYLDPWLYTGVGQVFEQLVEVFGWPYYFVRFPVTFVNRLFCMNGMPELGFVLLRYALVLGAGGSLYMMALRQFGRVAAIAGYLFLFCNPLFLRVINWDLTPFLSVPAALAGMAIWLYDSQWSRWRYAGAGALFCVAFNSHIFTITAIGCFLFGVVAADILQRRSLPGLLARLLAAAAGFGVMWMMGWLYYRSLVGPVDPLLFLRVNVDAMRAGAGYAVEHARPFASWAAQQTYFYVPFLWLAAGLVLVRRLGRTEAGYIQWVILISAAAYGAFYLVYRFVLGQFVIEEFYYFGHIWALFPLVVPLVVGQLPVDAAGRRNLLLVLIVIMVGGDLLVVARNQGVVPWLNYIYGSMPKVSWLLFAAVAGIACLRWLARRRLAGLAVFAVFCSAMQLLSVSTGSSWEVYGAPEQPEQRKLFRAAVDFSHIWQKYVRRRQSPCLWYNNSSSDLDIFSIGFVTLGDTLHEKWQPGGMPLLGAYEDRRIKSVPVICIFLMAKNASDNERGRAALTAGGYHVALVEQASVSSGRGQLYIDVIQCSQSPLP